MSHAHASSQARAAPPGAGGAGAGDVTLAIASIGSGGVRAALAEEVRERRLDPRKAERVAELEQARRHRRCG